MSGERIYHENLPIGTVLYNAHGARIRIVSMTGQTAQCEHITLGGLRDRRFSVGFTGGLPTGSWRVVERKDHGYEPGAYNVCPRCGDEREAHDRMAS